MDTSWLEESSRERMFVVALMISISVDTELITEYPAGPNFSVTRLYSRPSSTQVLIMNAGYSPFCSRFLKELDAAISLLTLVVFFTLEEGFALVYTEDVHLAKCKANDELVEKAVVKVKI